MASFDSGSLLYTDKMKTYEITTLPTPIGVLTSFSSSQERRYNTYQGSKKKGELFFILESFGLHSK